MGGEIMTKASKRALSGGIAGMGAQAINVVTMMWMRTIMNYQYRTAAPSLTSPRSFGQRVEFLGFTGDLLPA